MRGRALAGGIAIALGLLALRGLAQDAGTPIEQAVKVAPGKCIEAAPLAQRIKTWLKRDSIDPRIRVEVKASKTANDVHFTIRRGEQIVGEKDMRAEMACPEFQSAVALAIASALDAIILETERAEQDAAPDAIEEPDVVVDAGAREHEPEPEPEPEPIPFDAGGEAGPAKQETHLLFGLETGLSATHLPVPTAFVVPSVEVRLLRWIDARLAFAFTPEISSAIGMNRLVTQLVIVEPQACIVWLEQPVRARGCAGLALGGVPFHADVLKPKVDIARWGALAFRVDARWPIDGLLAAMISAGIDPVLGAPTLEITDSAISTQLPAVGFSLLGGFQVRVF